MKTIESFAHPSHSSTHFIPLAMSDGAKRSENAGIHSRESGVARRAQLGESKRYG